METDLIITEGSLLEPFPGTASAYKGSFETPLRDFREGPDLQCCLLLYSGVNQMQERDQCLLHRNIRRQADSI